MRDLAAYFPTVRKLRRRSSRPGAPPGTLEIKHDLPPPVARRVTYNKDRVEEVDLGLEEICAAVKGARGKVTWVDIQGHCGDTLLREIGEALELHPLILEDIAHTHQRPKVEVRDGHLFIVLRCIRILDEERVDNEQISLVLRKNLLVTFQERVGDGFEPVRQRLRDARGNIRKAGADYLAYALIDLIIDLVFPVLEIYGDAMDRIDDEVAGTPRRQTSAAIHRLKRELRTIRRAIWPVRDLAAALSREEYDLIGDGVQLALRDCHDHAVMAADFIEAAKERVGDLGDRYLAAVSERTNQVMKVLTMVATIFIPLTYLAGLYGMNFDPEASPYNMPELRWRYGYVAFWIVTGLVVATMLVLFWAKGWIGSRDRGAGDDEESY